MLTGVRGLVLSVLMRCRWSAGSRWYFIASMRKSLQVLLFLIRASSSTICKQRLHVKFDFYFLNKTKIMGCIIQSNFIYFSIQVIGPLRGFFFVKASGYLDSNVMFFQPTTLFLPSLFMKIGESVLTNPLFQYPASSLQQTDLGVCKHIGAHHFTA